MRALVQRVREAGVTCEGKITGAIESGLLVFIGVHTEDTDEDLEYLVRKIKNLRIFSDEEGKMNLNVQQAGGKILLVSQFTLYGDVRRGNRPSFTESAPPEKGEAYYLKMAERLRECGLEVEMGVFGGDMQVSLINDGPVTIQLDSNKLY